MESLLTFVISFCVGFTITSLLIKWLVRRN